MSTAGRQQVKPQSRLMVFGVLVALVSAVFVLGTPFAAQAQKPANVTIQATAGFDGRARTSHWAPVVVDLENLGASDIEGDLRVSASPNSLNAMDYIEDVVLPAGGRKRFTLYLPMPAASREIEVELVARGQVVVSAQPRVTLVAEEDLFVGVVGERAGAYNLLTTMALPGERRETVVVAVSPGALPDRPEVLDAFDVIILPGPLGSPLPETARDGLTAWLATGGTLVLPARAEGEDLSRLLPADLLPATPGTQRQLEDASAFEKLGGEPLPAGAPVTVLDRSAVSGQVLAEQEGVPLAVLGSYGAGRVLYLAFDPSAQPFLSWAGMARTWETLLLQSLPASATTPYIPPTVRYFRGPSQWSQWLYNAVINLPSLEAPSTRLLIGLIAGYILLVGPINFLLLRRLRRATLAWATVPALVLVFSGGTYFLAVQAKGNDVKVSAINVVHWMPHSEWARVHKAAGVFVPREGDYTVDMPGKGLLSSMLPYDYRYSGGAGPVGPGDAGLSIRQTEDGSQARLSNMSMWTAQALWTESVERVPERLDADLYIEGDRLKGTVTNGTGMAIEGIWLGTGSGAADLGTLAPGGTASVDVPLTSTSARSADDLLQRIQSSNPAVNSPVEARRRERLTQALQAAIQGAYEHGPDRAQALLVGWSDNAPLGVEVNGRQPSGSALTVLVQPVTPRLRGAFRVPGGMLGVRVLDVETKQDGVGLHSIGFSGQGGQYGRNFSEGNITYQFELPWRDMALERLAVQVPFSGSTPVQGLEVQAYRWEDGTWDTLDLSTVPIQSGVSGPVPGRAYNPPYMYAYPPSGPPTPAPVPRPGMVSGPTSPSSITATVFVMSDAFYGPSFSQALEGEIGGDDPSAYLSSAGMVRVRLAIGGSGAPSTQPVTLGMPTLALQGVAHGP
ncbi:MAG: hypothetical protein HYY01_10145 [Chloroflexi bacterium]|nr:hypothetical protein [Chloroflexota bacterium]